MEQLTWLNALFSLLAGSLTTLSPCVLPLLPLVVGGTMQHNRKAPLFMGLGMVLAFTAMGLILGTIGAQLDPDAVRVVGAWLLLLLGLALLLPGMNGVLARLLQPLASGANTMADRLQGGHPASAMLLGALLGLVWSPCSGPLLGSTLTLVASKGGALPGSLLLGLFGLGAATPLVAVAYLSRQTFYRFRAWMMQHGDTGKKAFGVIVMLSGLAILTGFDKWLEAHILTVLPDAWVALTTRF